MSALKLSELSQKQVKIMMTMGYQEESVNIAKNIKNDA
jgi:hypothetical protein